MFGADEIGLDLGTSVIHIVVKGKGVVLSEPAYVTYDRETQDVLVYGDEARRMYGKVPSGVVCESLLRDGVIHSYSLVGKMLRHYLQRVIGKRSMFRPRLTMAFPGRITPSERQELVNMMIDAGVKSVIPVDENVASAIGAKVDIQQPRGRMNIDIGGGRTNISIFSMGHQVNWDVLSLGGGRFDDAIADYLRLKRSLLIGQVTAEDIKCNIGCTRVVGKSIEMEVCGRSMISGLPRAVTVTSEEVAEALMMPLQELANALRRLIENTTPELANDIFESGIMLSGGGAKLSGMAEYLTDQLGITVTLADDPAMCVSNGLWELIDNPERYEEVDYVARTQRAKDMIE